MKYIKLSLVLKTNELDFDNKIAELKEYIPETIEYYRFELVDGRIYYLEDKNEEEFD